jgi:hypothetical protein
MSNKKVSAFLGKDSNSSLCSLCKEFEIFSHFSMIYRPHTGEAFQHILRNQGACNRQLDAKESGQIDIGNNLIT